MELLLVVLELEVVDELVVLEDVVEELVEEDDHSTIMPAFVRRRSLVSVVSTIMPAFVIRFSDIHDYPMVFQLTNLN